MSYAQDVRQALIANDYASSQVLVENYDLLKGSCPTARLESAA